MKKFKGLFSVLLLIAAINFIACSSPSSSSETDDTESVPETYTVTYLDGVNILEIAVPSDSTQYNAGDTVTVKFSDVGDRDYYTFAGWTDGTTSYTSGGTTTFTINSNVTLIAKWTCTWPYSYEGTKASSVAKDVGDIVFNDGSAMPYTIFSTLDTAEKNTKKAKAIALIFYKGTGLNSDEFEYNQDYNFWNIISSNTTTERTLGVGLKHGSSEWCTSNANAYSIDIKTTNLIDCLYSLNSNEETWIFECDKNGSDNLRDIATILTTSLNNKTNDTTGDGAADRYPAFYFAKNYKNINGSNVNGTSYETEWYLPSLAELYQIYVNGMGENKIFDINAVSEALGGDSFEREAYWSSSMWDNGNTALYYTFCGTPFDIEKDRRLAVCCIREFN